MQGLILLAFVVLNVSAGLIAPIWLLYLGDWQTVVAGVAGLVLGPLVISIGLAPSTLLLIPLSNAIERGSLTAAVVAAITNHLNILIVMSILTLLVYSVACNKAEDQTIFPYLLWAYAVATGPWIYAAAKESQIDSQSLAPVTSFFLVIGCLSLMAGIYWFDVPANWHSMSAWLLPPLLINLAVQAGFVIARTR